MIMVSYNRRHNRQHCQVDQSVDLQLPLPLQPLHQLPAPPLLLLNPLLPPHLNIVMRIGGPFLVPSRSGWRNQEMQKYTKRHLQLPDMFLQHVNSGGEGGVVLFYSCVPAHDQLLSTCIFFMLMMTLVLTLLLMSIVMLSLILTFSGLRGKEVQGMISPVVSGSLRLGQLAHLLLQLLHLDGEQIRKCRNGFKIQISP